MSLPHEHNGDGHAGSLFAPASPIPPVMPIWKQTLLWIAVLPGAFVGSTVVYWIAKVVMWLTSSYYGDDSWLHVIFAQIMPNAASSYALVFCAAYIAPRAKITVAIVFAAACLSLVTISALIYIRDHRWLDLVGVISLLAGAVVAAVSITTGEQDVGQRKT